MDLPGLSPYAFHLGPIGVHWYGILMVAGMLVGIYYMLKNGAKYGLDADFVTNAALVAILGGVIGARLFFVIFNEPQWFWQDPGQIFRIWQGGLTSYGGFLGGVLAAWWYARSRGVAVNLLADLAVPGVAVGYMLVRVGNIFNHELLGRHAAILPGDIRWPAQLVGVAIGLILLVRHNLVARRVSLSKIPGYLFWSFMLWYSVLRGLVEESVRDNPLYLVHYVNPYFGVGLTTMEQLFTPLILAVTIFMTWRSLSVTNAERRMN